MYAKYYCLWNSSGLIGPEETLMARTYRLKRRAERQHETRERIVEAAVELHTTLGPAAPASSRSRNARASSARRCTGISRRPTICSRHAPATTGNSTRRPIRSPGKSSRSQGARMRRGLGRASTPTTRCWSRRSGSFIRDLEDMPVIRRFTERNVRASRANCRSAGECMAPPQRAETSRRPRSRDRFFYAGVCCAS